MRRAWLAMLVVVLAASPPAARQETPPAEEAAASASASAKLDAIREDLVGLRFEKALAAIETLLGDPAMSEEERAELLVLRSQTHVASGDLDAAEEDYRLILRMRPAFRPDASLTPAKAVQRFDKVRAATIGRLRLEVDPPDAHLTVDGRPMSVESGAALPLVAGTHEVVASRAGYDALREEVEVRPDAEVARSLKLIPNSRTVVLRTEPDDVEVWLDGVLAGRTRRTPGPAGRGEPAELTIENIPLGEHTFELRKACFRSQRLTDTLTVDLLDRTPKHYRTVSLAAARAELTLHGLPDGARVRVDGQSVTPTPEGRLAVCPGQPTLDVELAGRSIWYTEERLEEGLPAERTVVPRPNLALVGAEEWPPAWRDFARGYNAHLRARLPRDADPAQSGTWSRVVLPEQTDLALAVVPAERPGAPDRWVLYSPILRHAQEVGVAPDSSSRPVWITHTWGFQTVDSSVGGAARVVRATSAKGPTVGDRVVSVGGRPVSGTPQLREALEARGGASTEIGWLTAAGASRKALIEPRPSPRLTVHPADPATALIHAAWSVVDATCRPAEKPAALANLALLFAAFGHDDLALGTWRRVAWDRRSGIGAGTTEYYVGQALQRLGRETEAVAAYRRALEGSATTFTDEGPLVAPAAADRLADLGVTVAGPDPG